MRWTTLVVGSTDALGHVLRAGELGDQHERDVVLVATAAAFAGATESAIRVASLFDGTGASVEALMALDREACNDPYFAQRARNAHLVVLLDGSALHARTTWRNTDLGDEIARSSSVVAIGSVATVLGAEMIDPRGGAPTTGLGYRSGAVLTTAATTSQLERTRSLLTPSHTLIVVAGDGVVGERDGEWQYVSGDVVIVAGRDEAPSD